MEEINRRAEEQMEEEKDCLNCANCNCQGDAKNFFTIGDRSYCDQCRVVEEKFQNREALRTKMKIKLQLEYDKKAIKQKELELEELKIKLEEVRFEAWKEKNDKKQKKKKDGLNARKEALDVLRCEVTGVKKGEKPWWQDDENCCKCDTPGEQDNPVEHIMETSGWEGGFVCYDCLVEHDIDANPSLCSLCRQEEKLPNCRNDCHGECCPCCGEEGLFPDEMKQLPGDDDDICHFCWEQVKHKYE